MYCGSIDASASSLLGSSGITRIPAVSGRTVARRSNLVHWKYVTSGTNQCDASLCNG